MSIKQFLQSIRTISNNRNINRAAGLSRHLQWQFRRLLNLFPVELSLSDSRLMVTRPCGVSALVNSQGMYDFNNMHLVKILLRNGGVFFDIGANIGSYTLVASEQESAAVYAFEPHPATFKTLRNNIDFNRRTNVRPFNIAIGRMDGKIDFTDGATSTTNHIERASSGKSIKVPCRRGSTFCEENAITPDFMKIDVEGFEFDVLSSFGEILNRVKVCFVEINGLSDLRSHGRKEIVDYLAAAHFVGPLFFSYQERKFLPPSEELKQDAVFVLESFFPFLNRLIQQAARS